MSGLHGAPALLTDLAIVLGTAAVVSAVFHRLKVPPILGYVLAGLVVGPHVPIPLVANPENVQTLSDLGVILLMFTVGLEFNARRLLRAGPRTLLVVALQGGAIFWLSFLAARGFGWGQTASIFTGAALCISSTMIASRLLQASRPDPVVRESVLSVLVMQDLLAILLLTGLATAAGAGGVQVGALGGSLLRLLLFAAVILAAGALLVPRFVRWVADRQGDESLLVLGVGLCFMLALFSARFGYSPALGAFLAGTLVSESGRAARIEPQVLPLRDLFSAIFFVSVGMRVDPVPIPGLLLPILGLGGLVLLLTPLLVGAASTLGGRPFQVGFKVGLLLGQVGEFSFVILGSGLAGGLIGPDVFTAVAGVSVLTLAGSSALAPRADGLAEWAHRRLPGPLRQRMDAYQSWIAAVDIRRTRGLLPPRARKPLALLLLESAVLVALLAMSLRLAGALSLRLESQQNWAHPAAVAVSWAGVLGLGALLGWTILRGARRVAERWVEAAGGDSVDADPGPRRSRRRFLQTAVLLGVGLPALAVLQPFLTGPAGWILPAAAMAALLAALALKSR